MKREYVLGAAAGAIGLVAVMGLMNASDNLKSHPVQAEQPIARVSEQNTPEKNAIAEYRALTGDAKTSDLDVLESLGESCGLSSEVKASIAKSSATAAAHNAIADKYLCHRATDTVASAPKTTPAASSPVIMLSQGENDYLFDLSTGIQKQEFDRTNQSEKLAIGKKIAVWAEKATSIDDLYSKFDAEFKGVVTGDYGLNRSGYINFAVKRLAPGYESALQPKTPEPEVVTNTVVVAIGEQTEGDGRSSAFNAYVFDPPSNCRALPSNDGRVVRTFQAGNIQVTQKNGEWYLEAYSRCWIHQSQFSWGAR
jgi:hypothetical protein